MKLLILQTRWKFVICWRSHTDRVWRFKALQTQELLQNDGIDFLSSSKFPGTSSDFNACKNIDSILKDHVERRVVFYSDTSGLIDLQREVTEVLKEMGLDSQLFCDL